MTFFAHGKGVSFDNRWTLNNETLMNYFIPFLEYGKQKKIADFLDEKSGQIDKLIEIQEKEIEKLKEYRTAVITKAVTKGLDETVPMKDSGIDWIGEIPEHWQIRTMKSVGYCFGGLTYSPDDICDKEDGVLVLRSSNIKNGQLDFNDNVYVKYKNNIPLVKKDDILIQTFNEMPIEIAWGNDDYIWLKFNYAPTFYGEQIIDINYTDIVIPLTGEYAYYMFLGTYKEMTGNAICVGGSGLEMFLENFILKNAES